MHLEGTFSRGFEGRDTETRRFRWIQRDTTAKNGGLVDFEGRDTKKWRFGWVQVQRARDLTVSTFGVSALTKRVECT